jgi:hypothetical protein
MSVRGFCQREQLTESAFYAWRRTIALRDSEAKSQTGRGGRPKQPAFLPVLVDGRDRHNGALVIELAGGRMLRLSEAISPQRLAEIDAAGKITNIAGPDDTDGIKTVTYTFDLMFDSSWSSGTYLTIGVQNKVAAL